VWHKIVHKTLWLAHAILILDCHVSVDNRDITGDVNNVLTKERDLTDITVRHGRPLVRALEAHNHICRRQMCGNVTSIQLTVDTKTGWTGAAARHRVDVKSAAERQPAGHFRQTPAGRRVGCSQLPAINTSAERSAWLVIRRQQIS